MQVDLDDGRCLVCDRSYIDIGTIAVAPDHLAGQLTELLDGFIELDLEQRGRFHEPLVVLGKLEQVDLFVVRVPVAPNAFEARRPVVEGVRPDADVRIGKGNDPALEIGKAAVDRLRRRWPGVGGVEGLDGHQTATCVRRTISARSRSRISFWRSARSRNCSQARAKAVSGR